MILLKKKKTMVTCILTTFFQTKMHFQNNTFQAVFIITTSLRSFCYELQSSHLKSNYWCENASWSHVAERQTGSIDLTPVWNWKTPRHSLWSGRSCRAAQPTPTHPLNCTAQKKSLFSCADLCSPPRFPSAAAWPSSWHRAGISFSFSFFWQDYTFIKGSAGRGKPRWHGGLRLKMKIEKSRPKKQPGMTSVTLGRR